MTIDLGTGEFFLHDNTPIRLVSAEGIVVHCLAGTLWITVAGVPGDTYLRSDQRYQIPGKGLALIESIGDGRVRLETSPKRLARPNLDTLRRYLYRALGADNVVLPKQIA